MPTVAGAKSYCRFNYTQSVLLNSYDLQRIFVSLYEFGYNIPCLLGYISVMWINQPVPICPGPEKSKEVEFEKA